MATMKSKTKPAGKASSRAPSHTAHRKPSRDEGSAATIKADLPWLSREARKAFKELPEMHGSPDDHFADEQAIGVENNKKPRRSTRTA
jgi:hypothetical protein